MTTIRKQLLMKSRCRLGVLNHYKSLCCSVFTLYLILCFMLILFMKNFLTQEVTLTNVKVKKKIKKS